MPIIKSAKKRVRVAKKAAARNNRTKRSLRNAIKTLQAELASNNKSKLSSHLSEVQSALDSAVKKGIIHKNKAARKKSLLSAQVKAAGGKLQKAAPKMATKPLTKKSPVKKTVVKKPAAKKAPAKKPATSKKPAAKK